MPLPVATIFSLGRGGNDSVDSDTGALESSGTGTAADVVEEESERILPPSSWVDDNICSSLGDRTISDTGRRRADRGVERPLGEAELTDAPRRRSRLAFSRDPASFRRSDSRRLCLGNCAKLSPTVAVPSERRRFNLERRRLEMSIGRGSGGIQLTWATAESVKDAEVAVDRSCCRGEM